MTAQQVPGFGPGFAGRILGFLRMAADKVAPMPIRAESPAKVGARGFVSLVGAGPGSADLITLRGLDRLRQADAVFYDRLADPALLRHVRPAAALTYVGKAPGYHSMPQDRINALLIDAALRGLRVVRLKCGDPGIFGRGAEEAAALDAAGVGWDIVPGVTAACAAAASAGSFLTERRQTDRLILATGHSRAGADETDWSGSAQPGTTLVCYMSVATADRIETTLRTKGWPAASPVEIVSQSQTAQESVLHCRLDRLAATVADHRVPNPAVLIIRWPLPIYAVEPKHPASQAATPSHQLSSS